jgi:excisionase family DNA binding protein
MIKNKSNYVTSAEAAELLGFSRDHVRKLIIQGRIKAEKLGRNWIIEKKNLDKIHRQRFPRHKENAEDGSHQ